MANGPIYRSRGKSPDMHHFRLIYRDADRLIGVVIIEGASVIQARLTAAVPGVDAGAPFTEGREPGDRAEPVTPEQTGREAARLLVRFEGKE